MLFEHPDHTGKRVRLAYCLNLHPAEDVESLLEGMRTITLPLREQLASESELFGVGLYLPAALASLMAGRTGARAGRPDALRRGAPARSLHLQRVPRRGFPP